MTGQSSGCWFTVVVMFCSAQLSTSPTNNNNNNNNPMALMLAVPNLVGN